MPIDREKAEMHWRNARYCMVYGVPSSIAGVFLGVAAAIAYPTYQDSRLFEKDEIASDCIGEIIAKDLNQYIIIEAPDTPITVTSRKVKECMEEKSFEIAQSSSKVNDLSIKFTLGMFGLCFLSMGVTFFSTRRAVYYSNSNITPAEAMMNAFRSKDKSLISVIKPKGPTDGPV